MSWMGKILGGSVGFLFGGPIGAVLGVVVGHHTLDAGKVSGQFTTLEHKQSIYFAAVFSMLGKLAKADGVVTQHEIAVIEKVMTNHLRLTLQARSLAIKIFNTAKESNESFEDYARQFYQEFSHSQVMLVSIIDLLLLIAHADGTLQATEEALILSAVRIFQLEGHYQQLKSRFTGVPEDISRFYRMLGANQGDNPKEIKKKYRKLVMEHHPDRICAKGMPPELTATAEARFKEIQHAWDLVEKDIAN